MRYDAVITVTGYAGQEGQGEHRVIGDLGLQELRRAAVWDWLGLVESSVTNCTRSPSFLAIHAPKWWGSRWSQPSEPNIKHRFVNSKNPTSEKDIPAEVDRPAPRVKCRVSWRNLRLLKAATDSGFKTRGEILMSGGVTYQVFQTMCVTIVFMVFRTQWHSCVSAEQCPEQTDVFLPFYETGSSPQI